MFEHTAICDRCGASKSWASDDGKTYAMAEGYAKFKITADNRRNIGREKTFLICPDCQEKMGITQPGEPEVFKPGLEERLLDLVAELIEMDHERRRGGCPNTEPPSRSIAIRSAYPDQEYEGAVTFQPTDKAEFIGPDYDQPARLEEPPMVRCLECGNEFPLL
jgi:hypothetical protein